MQTRQRTAADDFVDALGRLDFDSLARTLAEDVRFHALVPPGFRSATGSEATAAMIRGWFADADLAEVLNVDSGVVGDRAYAGFRIRVREDGAMHVAEQRLVCTVSDSKIATLDFLCSGFHSEAAAPNLQ
jgi:limonene-1,2-epoxide hydrolase